MLFNLSLLQKLDVSMSHTNAVINDGFYGMTHQGNVRKNAPVACTTQDDDNIIQRILPIIPKVDKYYLIL